jgi:hypothetical protein
MRIPASFNASLYFIIAATASAGGIVPGSAVSYPFGIISIMKRMVFSVVPAWTGRLRSRAQARPAPVT